MNTSDVLYLSASHHNEIDTLSLTIESCISLFIYHYCELNIEIDFIQREEITYPFVIPIQALCGVKYTISHTKQISTQDTNFLLPAVVTDHGKTIIAGLCAVLRWTIKNHLVEYPNHFCKNLLGFRGGCLVACTENSIWTKFCELQIPNSVNDVSQKLKHEETLTEVPENLILLEAHLQRHVRTHNILKRKLDIAKQIKQNSVTSSSGDATEFNANFTLYDQNSIPVDGSDLQKKLQNMSITEKSDEFCLNHSYLEGIDLTLADMIAFPCVQYLLSHLPSQVSSYLKNVTKWYRNMCSNTLILKAVKKTGIIFESLSENDVLQESSINITVPDVSQISLYKRDPSHTKMKCKHQSPDKIVSLLLTTGIHPKYDQNYSSKLQWENLPSVLHPAHGDLPQKRLDRKCQQLESIVTSVLKIAKDNQVIVEFCAGGGHVGLLLAYFLPNCKIMLIENKESSMIRAKVRASKLGLENIFFYQCNLDYFTGSFDIGVSLHACGVATDLVIQQCITKKASFVCCPCCYGSIQDTHLLMYPLSKKFQSTELSKKDYTLLAHFADRNEVNTPTADQGEVCMGLIDTDRAFYAQEQGYKTYLTTLQPVTCSPKHNLLIGISPLQV